MFQKVATNVLLEPMLRLADDSTHAVNYYIVPCCEWDDDDVETLPYIVDVWADEAFAVRSWPMHCGCRRLGRRG